jgi:hypothetical protein
MPDLILSATEILSWSECLVQGRFDGTLCGCSIIPLTDEIWHSSKKYCQIGVDICFEPRLFGIGLHEMINQNIIEIGSAPNRIVG